MMELVAQTEVQELSRSYFSQFFIAGGPIVWFVLLPMSVLAVYFWLDLTLTIRRGKLLPAGVSGDIITAALRYGLASIPSRFGKRTDLVSRAICTAVSKTRKSHAPAGLLGQVASESLQEQGISLLRRAEWCNLMGNVSPMVGLFGTVWGMIEAFNLLGISVGQPRPGQLAGAISVALVTTFWGLLIAIPCLSVYGFFRSKIESIVMEAAIEVETLLDRLNDTTPPAGGADSVPSVASGRIQTLPDTPLENEDILAAIQYAGQHKVKK